MTFTVPVTVRGYELDVLGHLNQAVYLQHAEHARWEFLQAAGIDQEKLRAARVGPVVLETTITYRRELRGGDEVRIGCEFEWGTGKTFRLHQETRKLDGTLSAEIRAIGGLLDLDARKLLPNPGARFRELAENPGLLGL